MTTGGDAPRRAAADRVRHQHHPRATAPIWSCATAAAPAAKTASATPKTPGWPTFRCTTSTKTASGAPWCNWPAS